MHIFLVITFQCILILLNKIILYKFSTIFGGLSNINISLTRLLWLPHRAYNSILRENRQSRCQDDRKRSCDRSKPPICEQLVKICNNSALVMRYVTKLVQKTSS